MASDDFDSLRAETNTHFDYLEALADKLGRAQIGDGEARRARDLEERIARAAGTLLELGRVGSGNSGASIPEILAG